MADIILPNGAKLDCKVGVGNIIGNIIIWILLSIVTLGLALFVYGYYYATYIINRTHIVDRDGKKIGKLQCNISLGSMIGHGLIWVLLIIVTLGLGFYCYPYKLLAYILSRTEIISL